MSENAPLRIDIQIPFETQRLAQIAYDVLRVDSEPKRSGVERSLSVQSNVLTAEFKANLARQLRVAVDKFFDNLDLISQTVNLIGPPVSDRYDHYYS